MNSRKWNPKRPPTPRASVAGGTFHARTRASPGRLPIASASPVSRNGGTCESDAPSAASVPHSRIAPSAARIGADIGGATGFDGPVEPPRRRVERVKGIEPSS